MKKPVELPSRDFLESCLSYDPETGNLIWKERPREHFNIETSWKHHNRKWAGKVARNEKFQRCNGKPASIMMNFRMFSGFRTFYAHRIIFALLGLPLPENHVIDHIDGNPFNNRLENLRTCTHAQNVCNNSGKKGKPLPKGVTARYGKFVAQITSGNARRHLGTFRTSEEAHAAYCEEAKKSHGEFFRAK
jgi:HNH endonuclease/AP2 domain